MPHRSVDTGTSTLENLSGKSISYVASKISHEDSVVNHALEVLQRDQTGGRNLFRSIYLMPLAVLGIDNTLTASFNLAFLVACIFNNALHLPILSA